MSLCTSTFKTMAFFKFNLFLFALSWGFLFFSNQVLCDIKKDTIPLINTYRLSVKLSALNNNSNAACLAGKIADELEDQPCSVTYNTYQPGPLSKLPSIDKHIKQCKIDVNTTKDGIILPICVPKLIASLVLNNTTSPRYTKYLNSSEYTGAGVGFEGDWVTIVLSTDSPSGSISSASSLISIGLVHYFVTTLLGFVHFQLW